MDALRETLDEQYSRHLEMIGATIQAVDEEHWRAGDPEIAPAKLLRHILICVDFYLCADEADWGTKRLARPAWVAAEERPLPTRDEATEYLALVTEAWHAWLAAQDEASLLGGNGFPWTGPNPLARMIYTMRHSYEHIGEVNALLRGWSMPRVEWR